MAATKKKKVPSRSKGKESIFHAFLSKLRKRKIIQTLAAFIGGGWLILEFISVILIDHYHLSEKILDIIFVTLLCALVCIILWLWLRGEEKPRRFKAEFVLIPLVILIAGFFYIRIILQLEKPEAKKVSRAERKNSIAVLPFVDISSNQDQEYFCDGMTEELIGRLSKLGDLKVISRTSAMVYKNTPKNVKEIGRELGVRTVLEGSVRKEDNKLRVAAQLINVDDDFHLWSETYDIKLSSVFAIQDEISQAIAKELRIRLGGQEKDLLVKWPTDNIDAYNLYLKGRYFWNKRTEEGYKKSLEYFEQAIDEDPSFSLAYTGIADYYSLLGFYDFIPDREAFPRAKEEVEKALKLDDKLAEAHNSLAFIKESYEWDWEGAEREYQRAIELNPSYATALQWYAGFLGAQGRRDESIAFNRRAQELDPLSPIIGTDLGVNLYSARQYDQAIEELAKVIEMAPDYFLAHLFLGLVYAQKGMYEEALMEARKAGELSGADDPLVKAIFGFIHSLSGNNAEARKVLEEIVELSGERYVSSWYIAVLCAGLGEKDKAFHWLERAYDEQDNWMTSLKVVPLLDSLRSDPRYADLLQRLRLDK